MSALDEVIALLHRQTGTPAQPAAPAPRPLPLATHLTRRAMRELPAFIDDPAVDPAGCIVLGNAFRIAPLRDGEPDGGFGEGWRLDSVSLLFHPVIILQTRHSGGATDIRLVDASFRRLGTSVAHLDRTAAAVVGQRLAMIVTFLDAIGRDTLPCRIPRDVRSFLRLSRRTRQDLLRHSGYAAKDYPDRPEVNESDGYVSDVETDADSGRLYLGLGRTHELRRSGGPIRLLPGWRIERISSIFFPLFVAELQHEGGSGACWYFDQHGNLLADHWNQLSDAFAAVLNRYSGVVLDDLWEDFVADQAARIADHVAGFLALPPLIRHTVMTFHHSAPRNAPVTATWNLEDAAPDAVAHVARTALGSALLNPTHVRQCLTRSIQAQNVALANEGTIFWPSPIDGRELPASGFALMLDDLCWAYRVQDRDAGLTFYVVADGGHFRTFALYLPGNDLLIAWNEASFDVLRRFDNFRLHMLWHAIVHGGALLVGAGKPVGRLSHVFRGRSAMQLGHFIWQDLSGIHWFLADVERLRIPRFLVLESHRKPEIYGPIESLFPSLEGKVVRLGENFVELTPAIYAENERLFKATAMNIPDSVAASILSRYRTLPEYRDFADRCREFRSGCDVVVVLGLRVGNRTVVDMAGFALKLLGAIYDAAPGAAVIVDGQNWSPEVFYESFGDDPSAPDNFLSQELAIARRLDRYARMRGRKLVSNIGRPIGDSLLWCDAADCFVAPWGAALAKYRWVCNKPGLTITNRWNLLHRRDLNIYHVRPINENPAALRFNDPQSVEDVADADETDPQRLEKSNFKVVDFDSIRRQVVALLEEHGQTAMA